MQPVKGQVYSLRQVELELELRDMPFLCFRSKLETDEVIQTSHLTREQLLSVPGFADTQWRYIYETYEWIPVFNFVGDVAELLRFVDFEDGKGLYDDSLWVTPKGFPREQV